MKVYAYITEEYADIIPAGQFGEWFAHLRFVHDPRPDEYRVQMPDGSVRRYVAMDLSAVATPHQSQD